MGYGRWEIGGGQFPISDILSANSCPDLVGALADRVREVGDYPPSRLAPLEGTASKGRPEFSVRYGLANP